MSMAPKNHWQTLLVTLVKFNIEDLKYYQEFATQNTDQEIQDFVLKNIGNMSSFYKTGVAICLYTLSFIFFLTQRRSILHLSKEEREIKLLPLLKIFPFDLLNKLICGNIFMRLFELDPRKIAT